MSRPPIVSVITPCFNGEAVMRPLLDSVLAQTYPQIQFIFVNDGSTDGTEEVLFYYRQAFAEKKIELVYVKQENAGLGGAINAGLRRMTGDYLCWPDADDYLEPTSLEERVAILEERAEYAVVTCDAYIRHVEAPHADVRLVSAGFPRSHEPNQFELLLLGQSIFTSGCHMARVSAFYETHPTGQIYPCRRGQNWQMLLPLYHRYQRFFLAKPLYNYMVFPRSMSRVDTEIEQQMARCDEHQDILEHVLAEMEMPQAERNRYLELVGAAYRRKKFHIAFSFGDRERMAALYAELKARKQQTRAITARYLLARTRLASRLMRTGR